MAITTTVSAKDKKLLVGLVVFLVAMAAFWFVFRPLSAELTQLKMDINDANMLKRQNEFAISGIPEKEKNTEELLQQVKAIDRYYPVMEDHGIDELLTGMALEYGFEPHELRELRISTPDAYAGVAPYQEENAQELKGIYEAKVGMKIYGTREKMQPFLDLLASESNAIRVNDFVWRGERDDNWFLEISLSVYMTDSATAVQKGELAVQEKKPQ